MNPIALFALIVGVAAILVSIFFQTQSSIDKKIESIDKTIEFKLQEPSFIKKVAEQVRLPFLVFDEDKSFLADIGASELIKDIRIVKEGGTIREIVIVPKAYLAVAPILESYDSDIEFEEPRRGSEFEWVFKTILPEATWAKNYGSARPPKKKFKLQIIELGK